jgi:hypothetical protein
MDTISKQENILSAKDKSKELEGKILTVAPREHLPQLSKIVIILPPQPRRTPYQAPLERPLEVKLLLLFPFALLALFPSLEQRGGARICRDNGANDIDDLEHGDSGV